MKAKRDSSLNRINKVLPASFISWMLRDKHSSLFFYFSTNPNLLIFLSKPFFP